MGPILILLIIAAMGLVVWALIRGLTAFSNIRPDEVGDDGIPVAIAAQNRMMFARVKWQAVAVLLIALLILLSQAG